MRLPRLASLACFVALMSVTLRSYADDASYTGASLSFPPTVTVGASFDISGDFTKSITGPATDYVLITIFSYDGGTSVHEQLFHDGEDRDDSHFRHGRTRISRSEAIAQQCRYI